MALSLWWSGYLYFFGSLLIPLLVLTQQLDYPADLMLVGVIGNGYCLRDRFEKIEENLGKTMTKEEGQSIEKALAEVKSTTEGLKTDMNELLREHDELKAHLSARVQKLSIDYVVKKR